MDGAQLPLTTPKAAAPRVDPWQAARAAIAAEPVPPILLRVILVYPGTQAFIHIPRTRDNAAAEMYDGATMIRPEGPYSPAERAEIIRWADEQWQACDADAAA